MSFRQDVEALVAQIPPGRFMTYGDIAICLGYPEGARAVGGIARAGTSGIPWQRVVNRFGRLGYEGQEQTLATEGVRCVDGHVVDFENRRWSPGEQ